VLMISLWVPVGCSDPVSSAPAPAAQGSQETAVDLVEVPAPVQGEEPGNAVQRRLPEEESRLEPEATQAIRSEYSASMMDGSAALYSGQYDEARRQYLRAMDLRPKKMAPALGALRAMAPHGHGEERANVARAVQRRVDDLLANPKTRGAGELLAARKSAALGKPGAAMAHAHLAAAHLPELGAVWRAVGEAAAQSELWSKAVEAYGRALSLGLKARAGTLERLADALDELGHYTEAESAIRESIAKTGSDPHAKRRRLNLLGVVLKHQGQHEAARTVTSSALKLDETDPAVLHNLAAIEEARVKLEVAERLYRKALTETQVPMTSWRLGHLLLKQDRRKEAVRALTDAAARLDRWSWPDSTRWLPAYDVGKVYALAGHEREAIGWFEDAMREARGGKAIREVQTWLTWARVQAGQENRHEESKPRR
jgi:tetratricopeptide (TPR) repeat protein